MQMNVPNPKIIGDPFTKHLTHTQKERERKRESKREEEKEQAKHLKGGFADVCKVS